MVYEFEVHHCWCFTIFVLPSLVGVAIHDYLMLFMLHHCFLLLSFVVIWCYYWFTIDLSCYCCLLSPLATIVLPLPSIVIVSSHCYSILAYHRLLLLPSLNFKVLTLHLIPCNYYLLSLNVIVAGQWVTVPENSLDWTWRVNEGTVWPPLMESDGGSLILCWWYFLCMECMALWRRIWWRIAAPHWWALEGNNLQKANQASGRSQKRLDEG